MKASNLCHIHLGCLVRFLREKDPEGDSCAGIFFFIVEIYNNINVTILAIFNCAVQCSAD